MKLWNSVLRLSLLLLALTFASTAHAVVTIQQKCDSSKLLAAAKFSQCRVKIDSLSVKKGSKLSEEKKVLLQTKCAAKLRAEYAKLEAKYVPTSQVGLRDDECSVYGDAENMVAFIEAASDLVADGTAGIEGSGAVGGVDEFRAQCEANSWYWDPERTECCNPHPPGSPCFGWSAY